MDFIEALKYVKEGSKIRRTSWEDETAVCGMYEGMLSVYTKENGEWKAWLVAEQDVYAYDWEVVTN